MGRRKGNESPQGHFRNTWMGALPAPHTRSPATVSMMQGAILNQKRVGARPKKPQIYYNRCTFVSR